MHKSSLLIFFQLMACCISGQVFDLTEEMTMNVKGTSTLHDWNASVPDFTGMPEVIDLSVPISEFTVTADVNSMDGGRGASMNGKITKSLKGDSHPHIIYQQVGTADISSDGQDITIISKGTLTIAGEERQVDLTVEGNIEGDNLILTLRCPIKMTEYNIEPPSAMFGQIQTKDDVEVVISATYQKK